METNSFVHYFTDHSNSEMSKYMLEMFFPVFTLALGYLYGKNKNDRCYGNNYY